SRATTTSRPVRCPSATATVVRTTASPSPRRSPGSPQPSRVASRSEMAMEQHGIGEEDSLQRLWTPYRMAYIRKGAQAQGDSAEECPFCVIPTLQDEAGLVIARGELCFAVLNLHPYNPGHLMVIPYRHVAELEDLTPQESSELMTMTQTAVRTIKTVSMPKGLNVGLNLGSAAGGSLSSHIHQ